MYLIKLNQLVFYSLNISGCGITPGPLLKPPAGVWSTTSAENPPTCGDLLARAIGLVKTPLRSLDISVNDIGSVSIELLLYALLYLTDLITIFHQFHCYHTFYVLAL